MTKSVCIIDDDELYKLLLKKTIQKLNLPVIITCFANGKEAFDTFLKEKNSQENLPDVIFLDINMPEMDGWEFMDAYLDLQPTISKEITIYIASSSIAYQDFEKAKKYAEISGYIVKPIPSDTVYKILQIL
ncbi:MAG: response regulator [Bacteroidetes bacterium HGW-Bacteroidetes-2]|jgi:CheY-like chemotaxis protein|nr:MAG: response regulator [Bacteroidetes bacterium HGW-Bacteroidetes-2]